MYLLSLATASPRNTYTQQDCFNIFADSEARKRLKQRSVTIMEKVLLRDNGIHSRRFSYPDVETIFDAGPEKLNNVFEQEAPALGSDALRSAMDKAKLSPSDVDALVVCTCTGYLCPGLSSFIAEQTGLKPNCELSDLVGMGCGAAIPSLRTAYHRLQANPELKVAVVAVEICSAAFYLDDDPGVIISACLFGDGAAATIWSGTPPPFPTWEAGLFDSLHIPGTGSCCGLRMQVGPCATGLADVFLKKRQQPSGAFSSIPSRWSKVQLPHASFPIQEAGTSSTPSGRNLTGTRFPIAGPFYMILAT